MADGSLELKHVTEAMYQEFVLLVDMFMAESLGKEDEDRVKEMILDYVHLLTLEDIQQFLSREKVRLGQGVFEAFILKLQEHDDDDPIVLDAGRYH